MSDNEKPCRLCGKKIRVRQHAVQIRTGRQDVNSWELTDSYVWHAFHLACYNASPVVVLFDDDGATIEAEADEAFEVEPAPPNKDCPLCRGLGELCAICMARECAGIDRDTEHREPAGGQGVASPPELTDPVPCRLCQALRGLGAQCSHNQTGRAGE